MQTKYYIIKKCCNCGELNPKDKTTCYNCGMVMKDEINKREYIRACTKRAKQKQKERQKEKRNEEPIKETTEEVCHYPSTDDPNLVIQ